MRIEKAEERLEAASAIPAVPMTIEGSSVLHQMFKLNGARWRSAPQDLRREAAAEAAAVLEEMERQGEGPSAFYSMLGHKGDFLFVHFRQNFVELNQAELRLASLKLADFLEPATSYLSVVELGLYDSSLRLYTNLKQRGVAPDSEEWEREVRETMAQHRTAMAPRLHPAIPSSRYICFYPMDRKRDASANWYRLPMEERRNLMRDHGEIGRKYAGEVKQIISGSIGFDDWEWGVDLFSDDPLAFKRLIYEMRFDEASSLYAKFGPFYVGIRLPAGKLPGLLTRGPGSEGEVLRG